jgi:hypothetical protein
MSHLILGAEVLLFFWTIASITILLRIQEVVKYSLNSHTTSLARKCRLFLVALTPARDKSAPKACGRLLAKRLFSDDESLWATHD